MIHALVLAGVMTTLLMLALKRPVVGLLAFYFISFMNPQQDTWGIGGGIHWALLAGIATVIGCLVAGEPRRLPVNAMTVALTFFLLFATISTAFALGPAGSVNHTYFLVMKSFGFMILACGLLTTRKRIHAMVWLMVLSVGYYGVRGGLFTILTGGHNHVFGPANTMIYDNNELATGLLITLPLMNYLRMHAAHRLVRIGLLVAMGLTLLAVVGTYSRGGFVALFAMSVFLWWNSKAKLGYLLAFALGAVVVVAVMPPKWTHRMFSIQHYKHDADATSRLTIWREAYGIAAARPLVGGGFNATTIPKVLHKFYPEAHPLAVHSIWFEIMGDLGFPAFFAWASMTVAGVLAARWLRHHARDDPDLRWADDLGRMGEVSIIAYVVGGTFLPQSYLDYYFMVVVVLVSSRALIIAERRVTGESRVARGSMRAIPQRRLLPGAAGRGADFA